MNASKKRAAVFLVFIMAVASIYAFARQFNLDDYLDVLRAWIDQLGSWGVPVFILLFALSIVFALPMILIVFMLGVLFGPVFGIVVVGAGAALGMSLCFFISRYLARERISAWLGRHEKFSQLDRLTSENGALIVFLMRLVPGFPFWLPNYGFGLTGISFKTYITASWLGILPCMALYVLGANAMIAGASGGNVPAPLLFIVCGTGIFIVLIARFAKNRLQKPEVAVDTEESL